MQSYLQNRRIAQQVRRDRDGERTPQDEKQIWVVADDDDPFNPLNWPLLSRAKSVAVLSLLIFAQAWAGAADSVANTAASQEFGVSKVAQNLTTAMYLFGIACGSLFVGPISEPAWITLIISAFAFLVALLFLPETYLPVLLDWKARHLRQATGSDRYVSHHAASESFTQRLKTKLALPATFFTTEPVIAVLGGYLILLYALLFSFLSGFDYVFKNTYDLSTGLEGACFGAIAAGATAFTLLAPGLYSWARHRTAHVRGSDVLPEFRLWPAMLTGPLLPLSLFWLGWTASPAVTRIWSALGACFLFGVCFIAIYVSAYEYIIDSYAEHAAIALASITIVRYFIAGGIVMAARPMYEGIGVH
ncbi:hypothetical protein B0H16DRAFT_1711243 [Mycena metata]|uniref:MFS general substrate transporter n=1 Tax=Mycena metata TaxID=1033252 RepID=A0AAD7NY71_9AGAR|nr:hypothetical protein B0H16DRAFT_1711243 [Mycena metata]